MAEAAVRRIVDSAHDEDFGARVPCWLRQACNSRMRGLERFPFTLVHGIRSNFLFDRVIHRSGRSCLRGSRSKIIDFQPDTGRIVVPAAEKGTGSKHVA
jgi:hypothetical protein